MESPAFAQRPVCIVAAMASLCLVLVCNCGSSRGMPHGDNTGGGGAAAPSPQASSSTSSSSGHGGGGAATTGSSSSTSSGGTGGAQDGGADSGNPPPPIDNWEWLNPRPTGDGLQAVWSDGTRAWAAGQRGTAIYSSGGTTWSLSNTGTFATLNGIWGSGNTVWAVGQKGTILGSSDGGMNFVSVPSPTSADLYGVWGSGATLFAVGDGGVVLRGDSGNFQLLTGVAQTDLRSVWGRSPSDVWAVGQSSTIYHSSDGTTFSSAGTVTTSPLYAIRGDATNLWVVGEGGFGGYAHFNGTTWINRDINPGVSESLWGVWAASPTDVFMAGDSGKLWHSSDDMMSRATVFAAAIPWQLTAIWGQGDQILITGGQGTLFGSSDHGMTFASRITGPHTWQTDDNRALWGLDDSHVFVAGGNGHVWRSSDGGDTWSPLNTGVTGTLNAITGRADGTVVASGGSYALYSVLIRSQDFGDHWTQAATSPTTTSMVLDGSDLWVAADNGCAVYHSIDLGDHWDTSYLPGACVSANTIWASGANVVVASVNQPTWYSTDKAMTWQQATLPSGASITSFWGTSPADIWAANFSGTVLHSNDGGMTWSFGDPAMSAHGNLVTGGGGDVFLASNGTVSVTHDAGQSWQPLPPAPNLSTIWPSATHLFGAGFAGSIVRHKR
jgi:photosystem II stability/assembly factor-like uncharacterized protein